MLRKLIAGAAIAPFIAGAGFAQELSELEVRAIHDRIFTLDTHVDIPTGYATSRLDPNTWTRLQVDLPKMRAGGLDAAFFIVYVQQRDLTEEGFATARARAEETYQAITRMVRANPERIALATTADEVEAIHESGRLVALIGIENSYFMGENIEEEVPLWAARGARYASITHFRNNQFGGSSNPDLSAGDPMGDPGLTNLGRRLVELLNDHGIMVDISHVGPRTSLEAIQMSRAPVIASHSGARAVYDHPRNLTDELLDAIRDNGGVAQMVAFRAYLRDTDPGLTAAMAEVRSEFGLDQPGGWERSTPESRAAYQERIAALRAEYPDATIADMADHIDYAVQRIGIDHVGIVSDFDGGGGVRGWDDASETPNVTAELLRRGYSEEDLAKLWGGNVLRVMRAVEAAAVR